MAEPTYDEVLKASLNSKRLLYRQLISSFMIKFLCNVEVYCSVRICRGLHDRHTGLVRFGYINLVFSTDDDMGYGTISNGSGKEF